MAPVEQAPAGKRLTHAQSRELTNLAIARQLTHGAARARVQNALVRAGLAKFIESDGVGPFCDITPLGHEALRTGLLHPGAPATTEEEGREDDLRRHLRSLRQQHDCVEFERLRLENRIAEAEGELRALLARQGRRP